MWAQEPDQEERVRIVREVKRALTRQRDRFLDYLRLLDFQQTDILADDHALLVRHAEAEQAMLREIEALERVCVPLEELYAVRCAGGDPDVPRLRVSLRALRSQAGESSNRNRRLLRERMDGVRREVVALGKLIPKRSPYAMIGEAALVDIRT